MIPSKATGRATAEVDTTRNEQLPGQLDDQHKALADILQADLRETIAQANWALGMQTRHVELALQTGDLALIDYALRQAKAYLVMEIGAFKMLRDRAEAVA